MINLTVSELKKSFSHFTLIVLWLFFFTRNICDQFPKHLFLNCDYSGESIKLKCVIVSYALVVVEVDDFSAVCIVYPRY